MSKMKEQLYKYESSKPVSDSECVFRTYGDQTQCIKCYTIWDNDDKDRSCPTTNITSVEIKL